MAPPVPWSMRVLTGKIRIDDCLHKNFVKLSHTSHFECLIRSRADKTHKPRDLRDARVVELADTGDLKSPGW